MKRFARPAAVLASVLAAHLCAAAPATARQAPPGPMEEERRRDELQETIEIYMIAKMKRFLHLSDEQERRVIPIVEELNAQRRETAQRRRLAVLSLAPLIEDPRSDEREIARLLDDLDEADRRFRETELRARSGLREALTPRQQARFLIFHERFRNEMQDRLRRLGRGEGRPAEDRPAVRRLPPGRPR